MTMIKSVRIKHIPSSSLTDQCNPPEKIAKESPAGKGGTITQGYLQLVMLLGAIIARSSLSIYRSSHLTWLDEVRQANTITYPPLSCSPLHKHTPPPFMYFDRSLSALTSRHFWLWPSTAYLQNFPRGDETLTCLTQSGRPISQQHLLLAKDPPPFFAPPC